MSQTRNPCLYPHSMCAGDTVRGLEFALFRSKVMDNHKNDL